VVSFENPRIKIFQAEIRARGLEQEIPVPTSLSVEKFFADILDQFGLIEIYFLMLISIKSAQRA